MKKKKALLATLIALVIPVLNVKASTCDYSELSEINQEASNVKLTYEENKRAIPKEQLGVKDGGGDYDVYESYFTVKITNVSDKVYVKVINSADNSVRTFSGSQAVDGVISFDWTDLNTIAKLTLKVYSSSNTSCPDEEILTDYKTLPKLNEYSSWSYCEEHPKEKICARYVTEEVTKEMYEKAAEKQEKKDTKEFNEKIEDSEGVKGFIKKNKKGFIIGGSIIIVAGVVTTVVVIKKRRSRLI